MNEIESRRVKYIVRFLEMGKPEYWITDALARQENMDRSASELLVARVVRGFDTRWRRRQRLARIGVALLVASLTPLFLGLPGRGTAPPIWPELFPEGSNIPYYLLIPALIGAFLFSYGGAGGGWRVRPLHQKPVQPLPPGQIAPGWPTYNRRKWLDP